MIQRDQLSTFGVLTTELILMLAVVASFAWVVLFFCQNGYLPQPFIFDTNDTFMDWFNTAYWANNRGAYSVWRTVYPPLSFVFLKIFSLSSCYLNSPFFGRDCDWLGKSAIMAFYVLDIVLVFVAFRRIDRRTAPLRTIAFALGLPMLFALERGNLIIPCFAFFVIAHGNITRSNGWRWLSMAITINFKPYLLLPVLSFVIKRHWRSLEVAGFATVFVYLLTFALVGSGSPMEIVNNTSNWVNFVGNQIWNEIYYSTSYASLLQIEITHFPIRKFAPSQIVEFLGWIIPIVIRAGQGITLLCIVGAWLQPNALPMHRLSVLALAMLLSSQSPGGYTQVFLIFLVFMEPWRRPGPILAIIAAYVLSISADWVFASVRAGVSQNWLSGRSVLGNFGLAAGQFIRPGLVILILWSLALDSLALIIRAHRDHRPILGLHPAPLPSGGFAIA